MDPTVNVIEENEIITFTDNNFEFNVDETSCDSEPCSKKIKIL